MLYFPVFNQKQTSPQPKHGVQYHRKHFHADQFSVFLSMVKPRPGTRYRDPGLSETRDPRPYIKYPRYGTRDPIFFLFFQNFHQRILRMLIPVFLSLYLIKSHYNISCSGEQVRQFSNQNKISSERECQNLKF